jgi:hypothetical protein
MLIVFTLRKESAPEVQQVLKTLEIDATLSNETDEFTDVDVNFEEQRDVTVAEAVEAVLAFQRIVGAAL